MSWIQVHDINMGLNKYAIWWILLFFQAQSEFIVYTQNYKSRSAIHHIIIKCQKPFTTSKCRGLDRHLQSSSSPSIPPRRSWRTWSNKSRISWSRRSQLKIPTKLSSGTVNCLSSVLMTKLMMLFLRPTRILWSLWRGTISRNRNSAHLLRRLASLFRRFHQFQVRYRASPFLCHLQLLPQQLLLRRELLLLPCPLPLQLLKALQTVISSPPTRFYLSKMKSTILITFNYASRAHNWMSQPPSMVW